MYTHVAAFLIGCAVAGLNVWKIQDWRYGAKENDRVEAAQEVERLRTRTANAASVGHEVFKEKERVVYRTITETVDRIVDRPVYRNRCLDDDGLRELNAAIVGADPHTGQPAHPVP